MDTNRQAYGIKDVEGQQDTRFHSQNTEGTDTGNSALRQMVQSIHCKSRFLP